MLLTYATPPIGKIHLFSKWAVPFKVFCHYDYYYDYDFITGRAIFHRLGGAVKLWEEKDDSLN